MLTILLIMMNIMIVIEMLSTLESFITRVVVIILNTGTVT